MTASCVYFSLYAWLCVSMCVCYCVCVLVCTLVCVSLYVVTCTSVPLFDRKCSGMFKLVNFEECLTMKTIVNCKTLS